jgi:hypothetical protein
VSLALKARLAIPQYPSRQCPRKTLVYLQKLKKLNMVIDFKGVFGVSHWKAMRLNLNKLSGFSRMKRTEKRGGPRNEGKSTEVYENKG